MVPNRELCGEREGNSLGNSISLVTQTYFWRVKVSPPNALLRNSGWEVVFTLQATKAFDIAMNEVQKFVQSFSFPFSFDAGLLLGRNFLPVLL
jgi:hypothetical protein